MTIAERLLKKELEECQELSRDIRNYLNGLEQILMPYEGGGLLGSLRTELIESQAPYIMQHLYERLTVLAPNEN